MAQKEVENYTREHFIKLLEKHFGGYDTRTLRGEENIKFRKFNNKEIAEAIGMSEAQFSRSLNPSEDSIASSYKIPVERVLMYEDATAYRKIKKYQRLYFLIVVPLIIALSLVVYNFFSPQFMPASSQIQEGVNMFHLATSPTMEELLEYAGRNNVSRLKWEAVLLNQMVKDKQRALTHEDSIEIIEEIKTKVTLAVADERKKFGTLNFHFPSGKSFIELVNETIPSDSRVMFSLSNKDVLKIKNPDKLPEFATPFDEGLVKLYPTIFDKNKTYLQVAKKADETVLYAQKYILEIMIEAAKPEWKK